jgi:enamine deaminase RidA (YjgF/YER057c/UK114 family)
MKNGEVVEGGIVEQSRLAIQNCVDIMTEAGYSLADVVHVKVILTDSRYFQSFNKVFREFFATTRLPAFAALPIWWWIVKSKWM